MSQITVQEDAIRQLAKLMEETGLTEIEVSEGEAVIRVAKHAAPAYAAPQMQMMAAPVAGGSTPAVAEIPKDAIVSPMVGTVYMSPTPGAPHFISVGDTVNAGDTLLIIEAMKVMNPIKAPAAGTVKQIFVNNAQPVEFGEALVVIA
jgi:acetyl-CoA carboxylase biotin carboxyl carrier protein